MANNTAWRKQRRQVSGGRREKNFFSFFSHALFQPAPHPRLHLFLILTFSDRDAVGGALRPTRPVLAQCWTDGTLMRATVRGEMSLFYSNNQKAR